MNDEPFHVLTEGIGVGSFSILIKIIIWWAIYNFLKSFREWPKINEFIKKLIVIPTMFFVSMIFVFYLFNFIKEKFSERPRLEFYSNGICHYDIDQSNRYIAWIDIKEVLYCSYPSRHGKGMCSDGTLTPRDAPSFGRGMSGVKIQLKNCVEGQCSTFIDSMYMAGFDAYLKQQVEKASRADAPSKERICNTLPERRDPT